MTGYHNLKELHVENGSLKNVKQFVLKGLALLERVDIENDCFSDSDGGSFEITNCRSLVEVKVGSGCFVSCRRTVFDGCAAFSR